MKVLENKIISERFTSLCKDEMMEDITDIKSSINDAVTILNDLLNFDKVYHFIFNPSSHDKFCCSDKFTKFIIAILQHYVI